MCIPSRVHVVPPGGSLCGGSCFTSPSCEHTRQLLAITNSGGAFVAVDEATASVKQVRWDIGRWQRRPVQHSGNHTPQNTWAVEHPSLPTPNHIVQSISWGGRVVWCATTACTGLRGLVHSVQCFKRIGLPPACFFGNLVCQRW
jgi:hypothetical protein